MQDIDPGFRIDGLLTANISLPDTKYPTPERAVDFFRDDYGARRGPARRARRRREHRTAIVGGRTGSTFILEGQPIPAGGSEFFARNRSVTSGYFQTMGIHFVAVAISTSRTPADGRASPSSTSGSRSSISPRPTRSASACKWGRDAQTRLPG